MRQEPRRKCQWAATIRSRWTKKNIDRSDDVFNPEVSINVPDLNEKSEETIFLKNKIGILGTGQLLEAIK